MGSFFIVYGPSEFCKAKVPHIKFQIFSDDDYCRLLEEYLLFGVKMNHKFDLNSISHILYKLLQFSLQMLACEVQPTFDRSQW